MMVCFASRNKKYESSFFLVKLYTVTKIYTIFSKSNSYDINVQNLPFVLENHVILQVEAVKNCAVLEFLIFTKIAILAFEIWPKLKFYIFKKGMYTFEALYSYAPESIHRRVQQNGTSRPNLPICRGNLSHGRSH